jgi:hypothetical protein
MKPNPFFIRCGSTFDGQRCGLPAGHDGQHTALIPSDAPWFNDGKDVVESFRTAWGQAMNGEVHPIDELWKGMDGSDFDGDGLTLCPKCHGAETRHGALCLVCQNEERDDRG